MTRFKGPNHKDAYAKHAQRLGQYMMQVVAVYDKMVSALSSKVLDAGYDGSVELLLKDYPELGKDVQQLQNNFVSSMNNIILSSTSKEWRESNLLQDLLAEKVWKYYEASHSDKKYKQFFQTNSDALKAFQQRTEKGMNLSQRLWKQSEDAKSELEACISTAIEKGMSAITLSKRVSQYLNDFPSMQRDYAEKYGHAAQVKNCQYNSIRLARSEINMAYRSAEYERWQQMDFILGYEVKLSKSHPAPDICNDLAGKYPKGFKFLGWHPNCMCYTVPIIAKEEDYWANWKRNPLPTLTIDDSPQFTEWTIKNRGRINRAKERGTLPYFLRDNEQYIVKDPKAIADERHKARTQADIDDIQTRWNLRKMDAYDREDYKKVNLWKDYLHLDTTEIDRLLAAKNFDNDKAWNELSKHVGKVDSFLDSYDNIRQNSIDAILSGNYGDISTGKIAKFFYDAPVAGEITPANASIIDKVKQKATDLKNTISHFNTKPLNIVEDIPYVDPGKIASGNFTYEQYQKIVSRIEALFRSEKGEWNHFRDYRDIFASSTRKTMNTFIENDFVKFLGTDAGGWWRTVDHLHELANANLKVIPKRWIGQFNKYAMEIMNLDTANQGYHNVYTAIEGAYNIFKLSSSKDVKLLGFSNVSVNTPYQLFEIAKANKTSLYEMAQRKFFDKLKKFVPLYDDVTYQYAKDKVTIIPFDTKNDAYFWGRFGHVAINRDYWGAGGRAYKNPYGRVSVLFHEFGHAYDSQLVHTNHVGDKFGVKALLDKYKWRINKDHGKVLEGIFKDQIKAAENACYKYTDKDYKPTEDEELKTRYVDNDSGKEVDCYKNNTEFNRVKEERSAMSDVLQAIFDDHRKISGGHDLDYMQDEDNQLDEFFAHMSEFYWIGNNLAKKTAPNLYREMVKLMKNIIKQNDKKK